MGSIKLSCLPPVSCGEAARGGKGREEVSAQSLRLMTPVATRQSPVGWISHGNSIGSSRMFSPGITRRIQDSGFRILLRGGADFALRRRLASGMQQMDFRLQAAAINGHGHRLEFRYLVGASSCFAGDPDTW